MGSDNFDHFRELVLLELEKTEGRSIYLDERVARIILHEFEECASVEACVKACESARRESYDD